MSFDTEIPTWIAAKFDPHHKHLDTHLAEDKESRDHSPCPSLTSSRGTMESDSDGEDNHTSMTMQFVRFIANRLPTVTGAKNYDGIPEGPPAVGDLDHGGAESMRSDHAVDGGSCKPVGRDHRHDEPEQQAVASSTAEGYQEVGGVAKCTEVDEDRDDISDCSLLDISGAGRASIPLSRGLSSQSVSLTSGWEDSGSCVSDDGDSVADELISRICDIVLEYCGGSTARGDIDSTNRAIASAATDFVLELLEELTMPQLKQCAADEGSSSSLGSDLRNGDYGASSGQVGGSGSGGKALGTGGDAQEGETGGDGPLRPPNGPKLSGDTNARTKFAYSCPYRKHNPLRFSVSSKRYKQCATVSWQSLDRLK